MLASTLDSEAGKQLKSGARTNGKNEGRLGRGWRGTCDIFPSARRLLAGSYFLLVIRVARARSANSSRRRRSFDLLKEK